MINPFWINLILTIIAVFSFFQAGLLIDFYFFQKRKLKFNFPKFLGLGIGSIGFFQLIAGLLQIPINQTFVYGLFLLLGLPFLFDRELIKAVKQGLVLKRQMSFNQFKPLLSLTFTLFLFSLVVITFSHTIWGSDAYSFWLAKASAFYRDGMITKENVHIYWPYDHPLLWPLTATWFYHFLGGINEFFFQIIPLVVFIGIILVFYQAGRSSWQKFIWAGIALLTPFLWANVAGAEYAGNADLLLSFFLLLAVSSILKKELIYSAWFLFFAVLTKNDALPAALGFVFILPFLIKGREKIKSWLWCLGLVIASLLWKTDYDLSSRYLQQPGAFFAKPIGEYMWYTAHAFREEFRQIYRWGIGWWVIFFIILINLKRLFKNRALLLGFSLVICQFLGYFIVYYLTPEDQASQIATSIYRLVLQVYPASLLLVSRIGYNKKYDVDRD